jgi:hypothetical protein
LKLDCDVELVVRKPFIGEYKEEEVFHPPIRCFGCGEFGHTITRCQEIEDLVAAGVITRDKDGRVVKCDISFQPSTTRAKIVTPVIQDDSYQDNPVSFFATYDHAKNDVSLQYTILTGHSITPSPKDPSTILSLDTIPQNPNRFIQPTHTNTVSQNSALFALPPLAPITYASEVGFHNTAKKAKQDQEREISWLQGLMMGNAEKWNMDIEEEDRRNAVIIFPHDSSSIKKFARLIFSILLGSPMPHSSPHSGYSSL